MSKKHNTPIDLSGIATGTAPLSVASTTLVNNLNSELLNGNDISKFHLNRSYATTTAAAEGYYRVATIPIGTAFKHCIFVIKGYTATGTTTESILTINLAYYSGNYGSQTSAIFANTSHSYNSQTNVENGHVLLYCRVSFNATNAYIDFYKYKTTAVTLVVEPLTHNDWIWAEGALTVNPTVGAYKSTSCTLYAGQSGNSLSAASAGACTYSNYGVHCGNTVSNSTNKTGQWEYFGNFVFSYNASYLRGHSTSVRVRLMEMSDNGGVPAEDLDDFVLTLTANIATHTDSTTFNSAIPDIRVEIEGKTSLSASDICALTYSTSTATKVIRFYVKLKSNNTFYAILPESRYGRSFTTSYGQTTSYCYFNAAGDQASIATLPTPAQGVVTYATWRKLNNNAINQMSPIVAAMIFGGD